MPSNPSVLAAADALLTVVHVAVVAGFVLLWIPRATARLHRWLVVLTAASWLGLGWIYGVGYCFLTDWHWAVKRARGAHDLPGSFIKYAADSLTGENIPASAVDAVAAVVFAAGCLAAAWRWRQERTTSSSG